jgi:hypothetical protein
MASGHMLDANQCIQAAFDPEKGLKVDIGSTPIVSGETPTTAPVIANITLSEANQEVVYPLPATVRKMSLKVRGGMAKINFGFGSSPGPYYTLEKGCSYHQDGLRFENGTLRLVSDLPNQIIELLVWT